MRALVLGSLMVAVPAASAPAAPDAGLRLVRSVSGTSGAQKSGVFEVADPRTVFTVPQDKQILVYFEWEGAAGPHHYEGRWKDPTGAVVLVAPADQAASGRRFGMYWTLALPETAISGLWALDVTVDGASAGTHAFEIRGGRAAARPAVSAARLYESARQMTATVECLGPAGEVSGLGVATALDKDALVVPFSMIDGAAVLRLSLADGRVMETNEVGAWSRRAGWATLRVPAHGLSPLPRAARPGVGDAVYLLDSREDGSRTIGQTSIVGEKQLVGGPRLLVLAEGAASGSPVLDASGQQLGVVVASGEERLGEYGGVFLARGPSHDRGGSLLPMDALPAAPLANVKTLAELAAQGHFMKPLGPARRNIISGVFAAQVQRGGAVPMPRDQRTSFSRRESQAFVFVQWNPQDKIETTSAYQVYDADNKPLMRSDETKIKLRPKELLFSTWGVPIASLPPAVYRVELLLAGEPVWRGWLRVTD